MGAHVLLKLLNKLKKRDEVGGFKFPQNVQWRSQNAEKYMHIKGRLLEQAVIFFNCVPFQNGNFS